MKKTIKLLFKNAGFEINRVKKTNIPLVLWNTDENFLKTYEAIRSITIVDTSRCFILYQLLKQVLSLDGEVAEVGVYKGGTAKLFAMILKNNKSSKLLHLFDTFEGMPDTSSKDLHSKGDFANTSLEQVSKHLSEFNLVQIYKGLFPDTALSITEKFFCFVHVDIDIFKSAIDCCKFFYPRLVSGGILIFDDYGFPSCPGVKDAVDDFFRDKRESPCYLSTGQCFIIKI